jgi:hypothetical protein
MFPDVRCLRFGHADEGTSRSMRPRLVIWFVVIFAVVMFLLIAPLPIWFRIVGIAIVAAAYWRYRWVTDIGERARAAFWQGNAEYEERKRTERLKERKDHDR